MTKDKLIELAQVGMGIHSPNQPEYIVCEALIKALALPEQKPVAWRYRMPVEDEHFVWNYATYIDDPKDQRCEPLYTTPPQRKPLTDEEILDVARNHYNPHQRSEISFARAIEAAIKSKNT